MSEIHRAAKADAASLDGGVRAGQQVAAVRAELAKHPLAAGGAVSVALLHHKAPALLIKQTHAIMRTPNVDGQHVVHAVLRFSRENPPQGLPTK